MICPNCKNPTVEGARFCEHCGKALRYDAGFNRQKQSLTLILPLVIFLTFLAELLYLGYFYFSPNQIRSPFVILLLILAIGIGTVTLYFLYMKAFEAKIWEKVIFYPIILLEFITLLSDATLPYHLYEGHKYLTLLVSEFSYGLVNTVILLISNVFLVIFFSRRLKNNRFLCLMVMGYTYNVVILFTADFAWSFLYRFLGEIRMVQIMYMIYTQGGKFLMVLFAFAFLFSAQNTIYGRENGNA